MRPNVCSFKCANGDDSNLSLLLFWLDGGPNIMLSGISAVMRFGIVAYSDAFLFCCAMHRIRS